MYGTPLLDETTEAIPASKNGDVLSILLGTPRDSVQLPWKQKREEELESHSKLLSSSFKVSRGCPFRVISAFKMKLHFSLMVQPTLDQKQSRGTSTP